MSDGNGSHVTRAELAANIRRIDENIAGIRTDVAEINEKLSRPGRWLGERMNRIVDYTLPAVLVGGVVFVISHL